MPAWLSPPSNREKDYNMYAINGIIYGGHKTRRTLHILLELLRWNLLESPMLEGWNF
jgi:hypothetical protein